jgi:hypothetical protein
MAPLLLMLTACVSVDPGASKVVMAPSDVRRKP